MSIFVQLGASRDGLDSYLDVAHSRGMEAVLIETPDYIRLRRELGRQEFDRTISVEYPSEALDVVDAIKQLPQAPTLILAGFERYIYSAYAVANLLRILPYRDGDAFTPPNKAQQRIAISNAIFPVLQPQYLLLTGHDISEKELVNFDYPLVVKPIDGGGGLGVFLVSNFFDLQAALSEIKTMTNYDGGTFQGILAEEYVPGIEYSVQGLAHNSRSTVLTFCKKFISIEPFKGRQLLHGFREIGYIATRGDYVKNSVEKFAQMCVDTFGYKNGPFHIDMVGSPLGYQHLEMGFRLSGFGLVRLVQDVSGYNWAEESFASHLDKCPLQERRETGTPFMGQLTAVSQSEIDTACQLQTRGHRINVQIFNTPTVAISSNRLKSDLTRHAGAIGRIFVSAPTPEEIEHILRICSPERLADKTYLKEVVR